jgi:O-antigen/teichoic acid export membrane protein
MPAPSATASRPILARGRSAVGIVLTFFLGQGALQGLQILIGLFLVRKLSVEAYAQFGLAYGFQIAMGSLMDFGFTSTIVPLVGEHRDNRQLVGRYVRAAKYLRDRTFWILAPFTALAFLVIMQRHHWNWSLQIILVLSVLLTLYSSGRVAYFSAPLFLFGRLRQFYAPQTATAFGRLIEYVVCNLAGVLNAWTAAGLNALTVTMNGIFLEKKARQHMEWPKEDDPSTNREVLRYILPATPAIILSAFQAQISLFLISIFGQTTNIAEVAALGRIGQLFAVLMTFNVVVVEPYIARLSRVRLLSTYLGFIAVTAILSIPAVLFAFAVPAPFLWLLGGNYKSLDSSVGWVVLAACINHLAGLMWIMNRSRKWLFWSGTILEVALLLTVQVAFIALVGVRTTQQAVLFTFASSFCYIVAHGYVGIYGFLKGPRAIQPTDPYATEAK